MARTFKTLVVDQGASWQSLSATLEEGLETDEYKRRCPDMARARKVLGAAHCSIRRPQDDPNWFTERPPRFEAYPPRDGEGSCYVKTGSMGGKLEKQVNDHYHGSLLIDESLSV